MASESQAVTIHTFAEFSQNTNAPPNLFWSNPGNTAAGTLFTGTAVGPKIFPQAVPIQFSFMNNPSLSSIVDVSATLLIYNSGATGAATTLSNGDISQPNLHGSFVITYTGISDLIVGLTHYGTGTVLLAGTFNNGHISGAGTSGSAHAATASGSVINFTSGISGAVKGFERDVVLSMTSINPILQQANSSAALKSFAANTNGSFSQGVPEPATWAMLIVGLGGVGAAARRRRAIA